MKAKKNILGVATILWVVLIFSFSLQSGEDSGHMSMNALSKIFNVLFPNMEVQLDVWHLFFRKCAHFGEYLVLGLFSMATFLCTEYRKKLLMGISFCMSVAMLDETLQLFVSGRSGSGLDVLIDTAGAITGIGFIFLMQNLKHRKRKS